MVAHPTGVLPFRGRCRPPEVRGSGQADSVRPYEFLHRQPLPEPAARQGVFSRVFPARIPCKDQGLSRKNPPAITPVRAPDTNPLWGPAAVGDLRPGTSASLRQWDLCFAPAAGPSRKNGGTFGRSASRSGQEEGGGLTEQERSSRIDDQVTV
jgi:hypothetical protein